MGYEIRNYLPDFTGEEEVKAELKNCLCTYLGCKYCIPVSNGTVAIEIALKALGLPRGASVIVPDISFIATATAVANCGLIPVYADIDGHYFGITLDAVKRKYDENVSAVILVHFGGFVNREIFEIKAFCREKGIYLIEDCAQAFACSADGKKAGTIGDIGTFSFQSSKLVNSGEGGLIVTNSKEICAKCEAVSNWGVSSGSSVRDLDIASSNFRLSAVQAYFIIKQVEMIGELIASRLKRTKELMETCWDFGIEACLPLENKRFFDCPFYFPVKSLRKIHTLAPREEYPMRESSIVKAIIKKFYPDLMGKYLAYNREAWQECKSYKVLQEVDFINISQNDKFKGLEIIRRYK